MFDGDFIVFVSMSFPVASAGDFTGDHPSVVPSSCLIPFLWLFVCLLLASLYILLACICIYVFTAFFFVVVCVFITRIICIYCLHAFASMCLPLSVFWIYCCAGWLFFLVGGMLL